MDDASHSSDGEQAKPSSQGSGTQPPFWQMKPTPQLVGVHDPSSHNEPTPSGLHESAVAWQRPSSR